MLIMYLFIFTKEEALILACYERYALILPLGIIIIDVVFLEDKWEKVKLRQIVLCLSLILVFMPLQTIYEMYYNHTSKYNISILYSLFFVFMIQKMSNDRFINEFGRISAKI